MINALDLNNSKVSQKVSYFKEIFCRIFLKSMKFHQSNISQSAKQKNRKAFDALYIIRCPMYFNYPRALCFCSSQLLLLVHHAPHYHESCKLYEIFQNLFLNFYLTTYLLLWINFWLKDACFVRKQMLSQLYIQCG